MSRGLLIAGGVLGGGALLALALKERERISDVAGEVAIVVDKAAKKTAQRIATMVISDSVLQNFRKYGVGDLIEKTRGSLPWPLVAAMVEIESGGDPGIFNYYRTDSKTKKDVKEVGYWREGEPLPDGKDGRPNAWAVGLCQIIRKYPRGLSLAERFDPLKSLQKMVPEWSTFLARGAKAGLAGATLWGAVYFGHNQGGPNLTTGLGSGRATLEAVVMASQLAAKKPTQAAAALGVALRVAARVPLWAAVESQFKSVA